MDKSSLVLGPLELSPLCCYYRNLPRTLGRKIPTWPLDRVAGSASLSPFLYMVPCKRAFVCDNLRDSGTKKRWAQQPQKGGWHFISPRSRWVSGECPAALLPGAPQGSTCPRRAHSGKKGAQLTPRGELIMCSPRAVFLGWKMCHGGKNNEGAEISAASESPETGIANKARLSVCCPHPLLLGVWHH